MGLSMDDEMGTESDVDELPIWVDGTQKWVTGLTSRTTCDDAVYALLFNERLHEKQRTDEFAIFERWRDVERPVQGRTKILKIWRAWGEEKLNVQLSLRRISEHYIGPGELYSSRRRHHKRTKMKHTNCKHNSVEYKSASDRLKTLELLAKSVVTQEKTIQELNQRISKADIKIRERETRLVRLNVDPLSGQRSSDSNIDTMSDDSMTEFLSRVDETSLEQYLFFCEGIVKMEQELLNEEAKIDDISSQIHDSFSDDAAFSSCNTSNDSVLFNQGESVGSERAVEAQLDQVRIEINRCLTASMMQRFSIDDVSKECSYFDRIRCEKLSIIDDLERELALIDHQGVFSTQPQFVPENHRFVGGHRASDSSHMDRDHVANKTYNLPESLNLEVISSGCTVPSIPPHKAPDIRFKTNGFNNKNYVNSLHSDGHNSRIINDDVLRKVPSKADREDNDSNSDTGLSSMHSDDSPTPGLETLV